jgi:hypothetical protein
LNGGQFVQAGLDILSKARLPQCGKSLFSFYRSIGTDVALFSSTEREGNAVADKDWQ